MLLSAFKASQFLPVPAGSYHAVSQCQFAGVLHDVKGRHRWHRIVGAVVRKPIGENRITDRVQLKHVRRRDARGVVGVPHVCRVSAAGDSCGGEGAMPERLCCSTSQERVADNTRNQRWQVSTTASN